MNLSIPRPRSDNDGRGESFISLRDDFRNTVMDVSDLCFPTFRARWEASLPVDDSRRPHGDQRRCLTAGVQASGANYHILLWIRVCVVPLHFLLIISG